jgi:hypothetical protein
MRDDVPHTLVRRLDESLTDDERVRFVGWARGLLALRESGAPVLERAREALRLTRVAGVVVPVLRSSGRGIVRVAWRDRTWAARFAFGGMAVAAAAYGGKSAGIAALGTAVGVPLWVVFGAGGAFAGVLADELEATLARGGRPVPPRTGPLPPDLEEAEWEFVEAAVREADALPAPGREPRGRVFVRAFREARARQRQQKVDGDGTEAEPGAR